MVTPVHTRIPGRARFAVEGLYRNPGLKTLLESRLKDRQGITRVSANILTGKVLVLFHPGRDYSFIAGIIEAAMGQGGGSRKRGEENPSPSIDNKPSPHALHGLTAQGEKVLHRAKERLKQILSAPEVPVPMAWHRVDSAQVVAYLESDAQSGLSHEAALVQSKRFGSNTLPESAPHPTWKIFLQQFFSLPVGLLAAAAGLSVATGGVLDAVLIMGVVVANAFIGYKTESAAEKVFRSLQKLVSPRAEVLREGRITDISGEEVVPGDILVLKPGTFVAADMRLIETSHLSIDESVLTGESMPVSKRSAPLSAERVPLADQVNMAFMGTVVTGGEGRGVVVATGQKTEMGKIQTLMEEAQTPETPIERSLRIFGNQLVIGSGGICGLVFLIGTLRGHGFLQMLKTGISLAAAAVPEGLPAAATMNFALGIKNMKRHQVLIRRLQAVETLGAVQVACIDKTGTVTLNQMSVARVYAGNRLMQVSDGETRAEGRRVQALQDPVLRELTRVCALCNETRLHPGEGGEWEMRGSPTEKALLSYVLHAGVDVVSEHECFKLQKVNYRSEEHQFMCTFHRDPQRRLYMAVKGSPLEVLEICQWHMMGGEVVPLTAEDRLNIEVENERMAGEALRVLGVAHKISSNGAGTPGEKDLVWLGLVGMEDPVRKGVKPLIGALRGAGIRVVMITGDQSPSAYAIAKSLNLNGDDPLTILDSSEFSAIDEEALKALASKVHVFSRVTPAHKLSIVQTLQKAGFTVAMTGDGINDGPALKAADLGIAMGKSGTDVAREVADVVLEDDNLHTLVIALRDGRTTYRNIRKSVHFFLATNMSEIMVMFAAVAGGMGFPLNVMQLLWINIISDIFPGLALSMEPAEPDVLEQPPRDPGEPLFSRRDFKRMVGESAVMSAAALGAYGYGLARYGLGARATTLAFQSLTIGQLLHTLSCRSETHRLLDPDGPPANKTLNIALGASLAAQGLTMVIPGLRTLLGLTPINLLDMGIIAGSALTPLTINEMSKGTQRSET